MKQSNNLYLAVQDNLPIEFQVERFFNLPKGAIYSLTNNWTITIPRQIAQYLQYCENLSKFEKPKWSEIAARYPGRKKEHMSHSTIIHNVNTVIDIMKMDKKFRKQIFDCQISIWGKIKYKNYTNDKKIY